MYKYRRFVRVPIHSEGPGLCGYGCKFLTVKGGQGYCTLYETELQNRLVRYGAETKTLSERAGPCLSAEIE